MKDVLFYAAVGALTLGASANVADVFYPEPVQLEVVEIALSQDHVRQEMRVVGADTLIADWAVKVTRSGAFLCGGGDRSTYGGPAIEMTIDQYVGGDCPPLEPGDVVAVTWEWTDQTGRTRSVGVRQPIPNQSRL